MNASSTSTPAGISEPFLDGSAFEHVNTQQLHPALAIIPLNRFANALQLKFIPKYFRILLKSRASSGKLSSLTEPLNSAGLEYACQNAFHSADTLAFILSQSFPPLIVSSILENTPSGLTVFAYISSTA